jgi:LytS/YehU family sensor histidine kinase
MYKRGDFYMALQFYYKALDYQLLIGGKKEDIILLYSNISGVLKHLKQYEEALRYYYLTIENILGTSSEGKLFKTYLAISAMYGSDNKNKLGIYNADSSIHYAQLALTLTEKIQFPMGIVFCKGMLAYAITYQDEISKPQATRALKLALEVKEVFKSNPKSGQYIMMLITEAHSRLALGEISEPKRIASHVLSTGILKREAHDLQKKIHLVEGNYKQAFQELSFLKNLDDSLAYQNILASTTELQTKYETNKKDAEIKDLAQQNAMKALEAKQKNQFILFGSLAFLAILGGLFFWSKQREVKERANKAEIEQRFLRSQLNPHFIFNALDSIQSYVLKNDSLKASTYMSQFSRLMRQVLENSREKFILLEEEISMLENYMELQKLQPNTEFSYQFDIDDSIDPEFLSIPPMFVQPFVENAIEHGVINGKGEISIRFTKENDLVNISVSDNGVGLSQNTQLITKTVTHKSLATSIIRERIDNYNEKLKTNIQLLVSEIVGDNKEVLGTKVELKVPFQLS